MKVYSIPSKFENVQSMLKANTGHVAKKSESTTAPQSHLSVRKLDRVDVRVGLVL